MKSILIHLEDEEYQELNRAKGNLSWKEVLLTFLGEGENVSGGDKFKNKESSKRMRVK